MDLRVERTRHNIINAFIQLRAKKPIEKITVTELAETAVINKATFYLHYKDIYDLSDQLEDEVLENAVSALSVDALLGGDSVKQLAAILTSQSALFATLFSGSRTDVAAHKLDRLIKEQVFLQHPEWEHDLTVNVKLSAVIYGCFHACAQYQSADFETVISALNDFTAGITLE